LANAKASRAKAASLDLKQRRKSLYIKSSRAPRLIFDILQLSFQTHPISVRFARPVPDRRSKRTGRQGSFKRKSARSDSQWHFLAEAEIVHDNSCEDS
jgi:hypothetical protein